MQVFICNDLCYKKFKKLEKLQEDLQEVRKNMKSTFAAANRLKRGVPTDAVLSPSCTTPAKAVRNENVVTATSRSILNQSGATKSLFNQQEKDNKCGVSILPNNILVPALAQVAVPSNAAFLPVAANVVNEGECDSDICKVQVRHNF